MRIIQAITGLDRGGAEKNLVLLVRHLDRSRFEPEVVCLRPRGPWADALEAEGVRLHVVGATGPADIGRLAASTALARRRGAALVHGWMFHGNLWARIAARRAGVPCLASLRVAEREKTWHVLLDRWTRGLVDLYTVNSEALARFARERHGVPDERIAVVPNACDVPQAPDPAARAALRARLGLGRGPVVVTVGRLHVQKDPLLFVEIAARVDARFVWVGDGPMREEAARRAAGRVTFVGARADVADWLAAADLFLFTSRWEGLPNAVLEAMAAGLPVVSTDFDGADEVVRPGTGTIVPGRDPAAIAAAVRAYLEDAEGRAAAGRAGRRLVEALYAPAKMARAYEALYERLVGEGLCLDIRVEPRS